MQEPALGRGAAAGAVTGEGLQVPAAVVGERPDGVDVVGHELPQVLGRGDATRVPAGHADDDDRIVPGGGRGEGDGLGGTVTPAEQLAAQVRGQRGGVRVVEDQGGGQRDTGGGGELVAQVHRGERVEAEVPEGQVGFERLAVGQTEHRRRRRGDEVEQDRVPLRLGLLGEPLPVPARGGLAAGPLAGRAGQRGAGLGQRVEQGGGAGVVVCRGEGLPAHVGHGLGDRPVGDGAAERGHRRVAVHRGQAVHP